jgi:hypothetical protein
VGKRKYEDWRPGERIQALVADCAAIANNYAGQGYDLSVRQLYYRLVAAGKVPNTQQSYKVVVNTIDRARMAGLMDWYHIVDRTRHLGGNTHWDSPAEIVRSSALGYHIDLWEGQERRVEVWVEKQALEGVIGRVAREEDIDYFACRGYSSTSAMWLSAQRFLRYFRNGQSVTVLHFGDHDPSGIDMSRDIEDRLRHFIKVDWARAYEHRFRDDPLYVDAETVFAELDRHLGQDGSLTIKRVALNMDQIQAYDPPPNPAKTTDSRYASYQSLYGVESWELDALPPDVLAQLVRDEVEEIRDPDAYAERQRVLEREREVLTAVHERWDDVRDFLGYEAE